MKSNNQGLPKLNSRQLDILLYVVISTGVTWLAVFLLYKPYVEFWLNVKQRYHTIYPCLVNTTLALMGVCLIIFGFKKRNELPVLLGVKHLFKYPPLSCAAFLTALIMSGLLYWLPNFCNSMLLTNTIAHDMDWWFNPATMFGVISIPLLIPAIIWIIILIKERYPRQTEKNYADGNMLNSADERKRREKILLEIGDEFYDWIKDDSELESNTWDISDHTEIADCIYNRIRLQIKGASKPDSSPVKPSVVLIGEQGSGKSSICRFIQKKIDDSASRTLCARISMWSYNDTLTAVSGVLNGLAAVIKKEIAPLEVNRIPAQYINAIESVSPNAARFATAFNLFCGIDVSPKRVLDRFEKLLDLIEMDVVLMIEDLERYHENRGNNSHDLGPINAMLHWLDKCNRIHLIVATNLNTAKHIDALKVLKHIDTIPKLKRQYVYDLLYKYRQKIKQQSEDLGYIRLRYPIDQRQSGQLDYVRLLTLSTEATAQDLYEVPKENGSHCVSLWAAITSRLGTPRNLKAVLRHVDDSWKQLRGEIDFDKLFVACTIKVIQPHLLFYIAQEIDGFRRDVEESPISVFKNIARMTKRDIPSGTVEQGKNEIEYKALVNALFWDGRVTKEDKRISCIQGMTSTYPTDYWDRFLRGGMLQGETRDQPFLKAIEKWKQNHKLESEDQTDTDDSDSLLNMFATSEEIAHIQPLLSVFTQSELSVLLREVLTKYIEIEINGQLDILEKSISFLVEELKQCRVNESDRDNLKSYYSKQREDLSRESPVFERKSNFILGIGQEIDVWGRP